MAPDVACSDQEPAESQEQGALIGSANQVEAVMANLQKRAPQFAD